MISLLYKAPPEPPQPPQSNRTKELDMDYELKPENIKVGTVLRFEDGVERTVISEPKLESVKLSDGKELWVDCDFPKMWGYRIFATRIISQPEDKKMTKQEKMQELKETIDKAQEQLDELMNEKEGLWKPTFGGHYWSVNYEGNITQDHYTQHLIDEHKLATGNLFKTEEEARNHLKRLKIEQKLREYAKEYKPVRGTNWYIDSSLYARAAREILLGVIHFETEEDAVKAVEEMREDLKWYFGNPR
jgi:hypothetical protein